MFHSALPKFHPDKNLTRRTRRHEAGHAFMAIYVGGRVRTVTIEPENDDGTPQYGNVQVELAQDRFSDREIREKCILVALAGPVAESLYRGEPLHPAFVPEWSHDWQAAWELAAPLVADERRRLEFLERLTPDIRQVIDAEYAWAAVSAIADHLLAFDTIENEEVTELVRHWLR